MNRNNKNHFQEILGEEWLWPMVGDVIDTLVDQQLLMEEKTEEQKRMEKYIIENILKSDEEQEDLLPFGPSNLSTSHASVFSSNSTSPPITTTTRYLASSASNILYQPTTLSVMPSYSQPPPTSISLFRSFNPSMMPLPSTSGRVRRNSTRDHCAFCKRNGEIATIYTSHHLFDQQGRVECPQLRVLVCELCGATGDDAHTRNYCPSNAQASRVALPTLLKSTPRQSDGRWRRRGGR